MAMFFDGVDDWVGLPEPPAASTNINIGSVFAWLNTANAGASYRGIVVKQWAYGMLLVDNQLAIYDWGTTLSRSSNILVNNGTWRHVGFTFQSGVTNGTILYIDGAPVLTTTMTVSNQLEGVVLGGGNNPATAQFFNGLIDDARIYNRALSADEVRIIFEERGADNIVNGLVGRWLLNEDTHGVAAAGTGRCIDISGNNNHGTPMNGPVYRESLLKITRSPFYS